MEIPDPNVATYWEIKNVGTEFWTAYSGVTLKRRPDFTLFLETIPKSIYRFTWDGKVIGKFEFDRPFSSFTIDTNKRVIYCVNYSPKPQLRVYNY